MPAANISLSVRRAEAADIVRVVDVLTPAVATSSLARWLYPSANIRGRMVHDRITTLVGDALPSTNIRVVESGRHVLGAMVLRTCVADNHEVWLPASSDQRDPASYRLNQLERRLAQRHPGAPHDHIVLIGVSPAYQRLGAGTALLAGRDTPTGPALPTYLLAMDTVIPLASRFGYRVVGQPVSAGPGGPCVSAMWRQTTGNPDLGLRPHGIREPAPTS